MITVQTLLELLEEAGCRYEFSGRADVRLDGFSSLSRYRSGTVTWARGEAALSETEGNGKGISCLVLPVGVRAEAESQIAVSNPRESFFFLVKRLWGAKKKGAGVGAGSRISPEAKLDPTVSVGCNCVIGGAVEIGAGTVIEHNVTILNRVRIGADCIIHSGAVIGTDGAGYTFDRENRPVKIEHFGGVRIGDRVEIGANSCIDRGTIDDTTVGSDTKLDNLVHIAHNVQVGEGVLIIAGASLCGSVTVGKLSYLAPGVIVKQGVQIGENSFAGMGVAVNRAVPPNSFLYQNSSPRRLDNVDYREMLE